MRGLKAVMLIGAAALARPARAADALKFGPAPAWVLPQPLPASSAKTADAPIAILLQDQQTMLDPGRITTYSEVAFRIQKPEGLAAGNLSIGWDPSRETATVNKLEIRRGNQVIDVLKSGQTFTTVRRESNLESAMLDGMLTANIQPEGLQEGDVIVLASTTEHSDPVLKGHVETTFGQWGSAQIGLGHARVTWPSALNVRVRKVGDLTGAHQGSRSTANFFDIQMRNVDPLIPPKGAPVRFHVGRMGEATDFTSWADVAKLMMPLYRDSAKVNSAGALREEVEKIRRASPDPKVRARLALQLAQERVRYVALMMGQGGYVPVPADTTWSRRFGDCKGKTALLLAILNELGIAAEPVLVNSAMGDAIADRLPMVTLFDHVLVRAHIGGKDYWLDGTRSGDTDLDLIPTPNLGWGLPLVPAAQLVHILPPPLDQPASQTHLDIDASSGIFAPSPARVEQVIRGDLAIALQLGLSSLSEAQRQEYFRTYWSKRYDFITMKSAASTFNKTQKQLTLSMTGDAKLDWREGYFFIPDATLGYDPDFDRPAGPFHDAPFVIDHPSYALNVIQLRMPASFLAGRKFGAPDVHETLAGVEYRRTSRLDGNVLTFETRTRSLKPEITYKEAVAAAGRLRALADEDPSLPLPRRYQTTSADLDGLAADKPASAEEFFRRGLTFLNSSKFDSAIADFTDGLRLKPADEWALANRGLAYVWKNDEARAEADLTAVEKINATNSVLLRARGLLAENKSDFKAAIRAYTVALEGDPNSDWVRGRRSFARSSVGDEEGALADSAEALKANPGMMDLRVMRANIFLGRGDLQSVGREADQMVAENSNSDYGLVAAGKIYARLGRKAEALRAFDAALAIKPLPYIYLNRAQIRPFTDMAGRMADLEAALKLDPKDVNTLAEKAEQLAASRDLAGALKLYNQVKQLDPDNKDLELHRAIILYKTGAKSEAERVITRRRAEAKTPSEFNSLCWIKATAGIMLESARADCMEALRLRPEFPAAMDSLAFVELRLGKVDEAISLYTKAIEHKTGSASYMGRAIAYARKGDKARSDSDRAEAIRLDQDAETRFAEYGLRR